MKKLTCEMCNSTDLVKQDGVFVCQYCGCKYSVEEAKKMMLDGNVDVSGSTVKIDTSDELANLYQIARRAKDDDNGENAAKYYDLILIKDPYSWEATFYVVYFKAKECNVANIRSAAISVTNCIDTVLKLIKDNISDREEQQKAYTEVFDRVVSISNMLFNGAYNRRDFNHLWKWLNNACAIINCLYALGDNLNLFFGTESEANKLSVTAWKQGVAWHQTLIKDLSDKDENRITVKNYVSKIKKYDALYSVPPESGGCYIATAVYGSYDCPQVWTLRRYRDNTLAKTLHGRLFIRFYYAVSPLLVKRFGHTDRFKKMWKGKLDRMIANLNANGIEDSPYDDRSW